jgi:hypothetical protein
MKKKLEKLLNKSIKQLDDSEITLLNLPIFQNYKNELRDKFTKELSNETFNNGSTFELDLTNSRDNRIGNYVKLYSFDTLINNIPKNITDLVIIGESNTTTDLTFDDNFKNFKNLERLNLKYCTSEFPIFIKSLMQLETICVVDPRIAQVPNWVGDFSELRFLTVSQKTKISPDLTKKIESRDTYISFE